MTDRRCDVGSERRAMLRAGLAAAFAMPARAQGRAHRLGVLAPGRFSIDGVRRWTLPELARLGFVEGRNLDVLLHATDGDAAPLPALAADLAAARCDVAIAVSNPVARLLRAADPRLPIVLGFAGNDPVADGLVDSLARPGGLVTGIVMLGEELDTKRLEFARELDPGTAPVGFLAGATLSPDRIARIEAEAAALGIPIALARAGAPETYGAAFAALRRAGARIVVVGSFPGFAGQAGLLAAKGAAAGLPLLCDWRHMAEAGCVVSYGASAAELRRRNAVQVARILRGEAPGAIPMERPDRFELVVNAGAAARLGLAIPPLVLARAEEVIE
ncbi:ABC transporter substrate binding protein [Neoroseomonas rubea]|uniref:ABC transporter substrate binding protein n=1 Tax=Neoroseomonas rubea TaxID=2748666 RepID=UPI0018DFD737|nr:ABC transporter substrate binding protein [Roseomonas rubea]